jgi:hypothetical protein
MTVRTARLLASLGWALALGGCVSFSEVSIETPIQPKLDISAFQRVLVAGFIAGGSEEVDTNLETVRLLRSQLRTKADLKVIEADVLPLMEVASQPGSAPQAGDHAAGNTAPPDAQQSRHIRDEKALEVYDPVFANVEYWKKIGEEFQNPLIVTGTILFEPNSRSGYVQTEQETYDAFGRRVIAPVRAYRERKGFILRPKFIFIDGRTGATLYSETFREEVLYNQDQNTPALSSYFELMDRLIPSFLGTLSSQKVKGTRILLK